MQFINGLHSQNILFYWHEHTRVKRNVKDGAGMDLHIQPDVEIIFVTDGMIDIQVNGRTEIARTNEAALLFPFQPHGYKKYGGSEFLRFNFDVSLAYDFFNSHSNSIGKRSVFKASEITALCVKNNFVGKREVSRFTVQSFLYSALADFTSQIEIVPKKENDSILLKAIDYIIKNQSNELDLVSVAKALGYSKSHFSRAVNKPSGLNFNNLVAMIRVENAKMLLRDTDKSILEIVLECGFGSERSFYRQFKDVTGEAPLKYRTSSRLRPLKNGKLVDKIMTCKK